MNSAQGRFDAEHDDQPFNLAPAAIVQVVADIAARLGTICRLQSGGFAKLVDERFCFDNIARFDIERQKHRFVGLSSSGSGGRQTRVKWPVCKTVNRARVSPFRQSNWLADIKHDDVALVRFQHERSSDQNIRPVTLNQVQGDSDARRCISIPTVRLSTMFALACATALVAKGPHV